jgi:hypothetical protein
MTSYRICSLAGFVAVVSSLSLGPLDVWAQKCGGFLAEGGNCSTGPEPILPGGCPLPPGCDLTKVSTYGKCVQGGISACNCNAMPNMHSETGSDGNQYCVPDKPDPKCPRAFDATGSNPACRIYPIRPKNATDPNDKVGTLGVGEAGFVPAVTPLNYAVHFENLATASAAAQIVVVTDQLDVQKMDLGTFQLGPITFGDFTLLPEPATQSFTGGIDLRPDQDLEVAVTASLDKSTGLVTWRFTSIDPETGQVTDDPDAGFLPPNVTPPAGEGSVVFSVMPKNGLATGTAIRNQAQVVFDTNGPIATPTWLNTIDKDPPSTHILALAAMQAAPMFNVQWTGTDAGAGIRDFSVYISDNGGPFTLWQEHTSGLAANFTGTIGHSYGFFALGTDLVGNVESPKTVADTTTQIVNTPVCASNVSAQVQVTRSGFGYNFTTQRFVQTVTLKNVSGAITSSPISLVLDSLSSNATLFNATGTTACATPAGSPFINWSSSLAPGASGSIVLQFTNPSKAGITYATRVLAGSEGR